MNTFSKILFLTTLALGLAASARAADVTGKWKSEFETPVGATKYTYDLKAQGEKLTGKAVREVNGQKTEVEIKEGKVAGDAVSFVELLNIQDQEIRIEYKGKIAGDEIKFTRAVGDFGTLDIVAKREKTASLAGKWQSEFDTQIGHLKYTYDLKVEGDKVTGKAIREVDGEKTETELKEGKLTGDDVSFVEPLNLQDQDIRIEYKGKFAGDEIKFTRKVGDFATTEIVAKRAKEPAAK